MTQKTGSLATLLAITAVLALLMAPYVANSSKARIEANTASQKVLPTLDPALVPVCTCESGQDTGEPQQYDIHTGGVLHGKQNPKDIGMCQVNEHWNGKAATEMGWDIYTTEGNILMANWLYAHYGKTPWNWSKGCWGNK